MIFIIALLIIFGVGLSFLIGAAVGRLLFGDIKKQTDIGTENELIGTAEKEFELDCMKIISYDGKVENRKV